MLTGDILTEGNTLLADKEIEQLAVLRASRGFMEYIRSNDPVGKQSFQN